MHDFGLPLVFAIVLGAATLCPGTMASAQANDEASLCDVVSFQIDNDEVGGTDRHYTGGLRLACARTSSNFLHNLLPPKPEADAIARDRSTYALGQSMFTPEDLEESELIEDDQPYAGWLYLGFGLERDVVPKSDSPRYLDSVELQLGVVGPLSGAELLQTSTHDWLNVTEPQGWDNQLENEPGINLFYSREWTGLKEVSLTSGGYLPRLSLDVTPEIGLAFGNVHINGAGGLTVRLGSFLPDDHGPPVIRPSLPGSDYFSAQDGFSAYLFGGVEGRVVARNIFLDGNTFRDDSPSVDKNILVGEGRLGAVLTYENFRLSYTHVFRSQEFEGQSPQTYGTVTLSLGL